MFAMTAAHPTLPIPSYARVTRPDTGESVVVRINDRGPFLRGRIIDLSYAAASRLGFIEQGSTTVIVEAVLPQGMESMVASARTPAPVANGGPRMIDDIVEGGAGGGHFLQLGAFSSHDNAESLRMRLANTLGELGEKLRVRSVGKLHRVQMGPWANRQEAERVAEQLRAAFDLPSVIVR